MEIDDFQARLDILERECGVERPNRPPLETYTTTTTKDGDVVRATPDYVRWFLRTYPRAGREDRACLPAPGPTSEGVGREAPKARWRQPALT